MLKFNTIVRLTVSSVLKVLSSRYRGTPDTVIIGQLDVPRRAFSRLVRGFATFVCSHHKR